MNIIKVSLS